MPTDAFPGCLLCKTQLNRYITKHVCPTWHKEGIGEHFSQHFCVGSSTPTAAVPCKRYMNLIPIRTDIICSPRSVARSDAAAHIKPGKQKPRNSSVHWQVEMLATARCGEQHVTGTCEWSQGMILAGIINAAGSLAVGCIRLTVAPFWHKYLPGRTWGGCST